MIIASHGIFTLSRDIVTYNEILSLVLLVNANTNANLKFCLIIILHLFKHRLCHISMQVNTKFSLIHVYLSHKSIIFIESFNRCYLNVSVWSVRRELLVNMNYGTLSLVMKVNARAMQNDHLCLIFIYNIQRSITCCFLMSYTVFYINIYLNKPLIIYLLRDYKPRYIASSVSWS